jgi:hypothetical protein
VSGLSPTSFAAETLRPVDQNIDLTEGVLAGFSDLGRLLVIGKITENTCCLSPSLDNLGGHALGRVRFSAVDDDARSFLGERFGDAFADAGGTAGDQRYFVLQLQVHESGLVLLFARTRTMVEIARLGHLSSARQPTLAGNLSP